MRHGALCGDRRVCGGDAGRQRSRRRATRRRHAASARSVRASRRARPRRPRRPRPAAASQPVMPAQPGATLPAKPDRRPAARGAVGRVALARADRRHRGRARARRAAVAFRPARGPRLLPAAGAARGRRRLRRAHAALEARRDAAATARVRRPRPARRAPATFEMPPAPQWGGAPRIEPTLGRRAGSTSCRFRRDSTPTASPRHAKEQFIRLQAAYDAGDRKALAEVMTPEMFAEVARELDSGAARVPTKVETLDAEVLDVETAGRPPLGERPLHRNAARGRRRRRSRSTKCGT